MFWETKCLALTDTTFTAFLEESTNPFVNVPIKLDCGAVEVPSEWSSVGDFGDESIPNPLVKRAKVDFAAFPEFSSSWDPVNGWGIFKLLAHVDSLEGPSCVGTEFTLKVSILAVTEGCGFDALDDCVFIVLAQSAQKCQIILHKKVHHP